MVSRVLLALLVAACCFVSVQAQGPGDGSLESVGAVLKPVLVSAMPPVLFERSTDWGRQTPAPNGLKWKGLEPRVTKTLRNDGTWRKVRMTPRDLPRTLELRLYDLRSVDADRQAFKVSLAFQANVEYEQQNWESGLRLWSGSVRARMRIKLNLECENLVRLESGKGVLPDVVFRLRVTKAAVGYDNLVVEHLPGFGGSAARVTGEALRSALKRWKPSLERDVTAKASAAIVKAADTREVRLGLGGASKKKG